MTLVVVLDPVAPTASTQPLVVSKVDTSIPRLDVEPSNSFPKTPSPEDGHMTLLRRENLAWNRFKKVVRNEVVSICYDMFVKEFEHSTILDLSKVTYPRP